MRVVLRREVKGVGRPGDVKDVADGYATNYLLPRGLAVEATASALHEIERQRANAKARVDRDLTSAREAASRLADVTLEFRLRSGVQGRVFGSVTNRDVAEALAARGFPVDRGNVQLDDPLRSLGTHDVRIRLAGGAHATVRVRIEPDSSS